MPTFATGSAPCVPGHKDADADTGKVEDTVTEAVEVEVRVKVQVRVEDAIVVDD